MTFTGHGYGSEGRRYGASLLAAGSCTDGLTWLSCDSHLPISLRQFTVQHQATQHINIFDSLVPVPDKSIFRRCKIVNTVHDRDLHHWEASQVTLLPLPHLPPLNTDSTLAIADTMPRNTKKPAGLQPDASLLGIPPEMRNTIYRMVADDMDEVSMIGHKLNWSKATSKNHLWLWNAMIKHPLSQTCRQLRQEFSPIHRCRVITTGVSRYRLELENFNLHRSDRFAELIGSMPKIIRDKLSETVIRRQPIIRYNLTNNLFTSIRELETRWRDLYPIFSKLNRALGFDAFRGYHVTEVNLNFRSRTMSPALRKIAPTQDLVTRAKRELQQTCERNHKDFSYERLNLYLLDQLFNKLKAAYSNHFKPLRLAREARASRALEEHLENKLRTRLRNELKAELRAEVMNELKEEAQVELEKWIQEGLESWSSG